MQRGDDVGKSAFLARLLDGSAAETAEAAKHNRLQGKALPADRQTLSLAVHPSDAVGKIRPSPNR
jgi:hypothetical protein